MNCYMNIPQCAEQAERIRQTLEALSRAHERIVETLRQLEDQTCPETIDALRRMESSLAGMRAETLWLYRTLRAVSMEDWIRQYPCTSSFRLPGNERADDWLIEQMLRAFADADTDTATDRGQEKQ